MKTAELRRAMAKVTGPLLSISASGSLGKHMTFRAGRSGVVLTRHVKKYAQTSELQLMQQQYMIAMAEIWRDLPANEKTLWEAVGKKRRCTGWAAYWAECNYQFVEYPTNPYIPDDNL
jgi:hypothetical protein